MHHATVQSGAYWAIVFWLVAALALVASGCLHEGSDPPSPPPAEDSWTSLFEGVGSFTSEAQPTEEVLTETEFGSILDSFSTAATPYDTIADDLTALNSDWLVSADDISGFVNTACTVSAEEAAAQLALFVPGADLAALPALNQAIILVPETCQVTNPDFMDALSNGVLDYLRSNQSIEVVAASSFSPEPQALTLAYGAACSGLGYGLNRWARQTFNARGIGGLALAMTVGAAMTQCPAALRDIVG